jgi:hypothetical protein
MDAVVSQNRVLSMAKKNEIYVERREQGDYAVRRPGSERASDVLPTQQLAIERAAEIAPNAAIHVERVRNTETSGRDKSRNPGRIQAAGQVPSKEVTIIPGVVWEFRGDDAVVELTSQGQVHRRFMAAGALKRAGINEEGQVFELRITELAPSSPARWEVEVRSTTPPGELAPRQLRPNADFSRFKRRARPAPMENRRC